MRTKERKFVFSELLPWHKEVTQGFQGASEYQNGRN